MFVGRSAVLVAHACLQPRQLHPPATQTSSDRFHRVLSS